MKSKNGRELPSSYEDKVRGSLEMIKGLKDLLGLSQAEIFGLVKKVGEVFELPVPDLSDCMLDLTKEDIAKAMKVKINERIAFFSAKKGIKKREAWQIVKNGVDMFDVLAETYENPDRNILKIAEERNFLGRVYDITGNMEKAARLNIKWNLDEWEN